MKRASWDELDENAKLLSGEDEMKPQHTPWEKEHKEKCGPECTGYCPLRARIYDKYHAAVERGPAADVSRGHTPTPWWINKTNGEGNEICSGENSWTPEGQAKVVTVAIVHGPAGEWAKVGPEHEANAAFIVRAVNAHEEMLNLLRRCHTWIANNSEMCVDEPLARDIYDAISRAEGKE